MFTCGPALLIPVSGGGGGGGTRTYIGRTSPAYGSGSPNQTDRAWFQQMVVPVGGMNIDGVRYRSGSGSPGAAMFKGAVHLDDGTGLALGARILLCGATACPAANSVSLTSSGTSVLVAAGTVIWVGATYFDNVGNSTVDGGGTGVSLLNNGNYSYASPPGTPPTTSANYVVNLSFEATGIN